MQFSKHTFVHPGQSAGLGVGVIEGLLGPVVRHQPDEQHPEEQPADKADAAQEWSEDETDHGRDERPYPDQNPRLRASDEFLEFLAS